MILLISNVIIRKLGLDIRTLDKHPLLSTIIPAIPLFYYSLGNFAGKKLILLIERIPIVSLCLLFCFLCIMSIIFVYTNSFNVLSAVNGIFMVVFLSAIFVKLPQISINNQLSFLGQNTLTILFLHLLVYNILKVFIPVEMSPIYNACLRMALTWLIMVFTIIIINKKIPFIIGKSSNKNKI